MIFAFCISSARHNGIGEAYGSAQAHKCKERRWAQVDEKRSGGSKASFQTTKQEGSYGQTNLRMNLMLFYLAAAFQQLKVCRGRQSCLYWHCLFVLTGCCIQSLSNNKSSDDLLPSPGRENNPVSHLHCCESVRLLMGQSFWGEATCGWKRRKTEY